MRVDYGEGNTDYGPGVAIYLNGDEVATLLLALLFAPAPFLRPDEGTGPAAAREGQRLWIADGYGSGSVREWTVRPAREAYRPDWKWELLHEDAPLWNGRRPVWHQPFHDGMRGWATRDQALRHLERIKGERR